MKDPKEITLPSGAVLKILPAPFAAAKALYQAVLSELRGISLSTSQEMGNLYKEIFCIGFSSPDIERCLWKCFERCLYNGVKITEATFEPVESRDDYMKVCVEVARENINPFGKSLFAEYQGALATIKSTQP